MPHDAVNKEMRLTCTVDAATQVKIVDVWAGFLRKNGEYSCQLLIGRSLLAREESTIPKEELEALTIGSNLLWICRQALEGWVSDYLLVSDSTISICWVTSEGKRLSLYHRNRAIQVRRGTNMDRLFHVTTEHNPADLGTRPEKVHDSDVGPDSRWERGLLWMQQVSIDQSILTPSACMRMKDDDKEEFEKGLVFERTPEILVRRHLSKRVEKIKYRAMFSYYILSPTKFSFRKVVRVTGYVFKFLRKFKCLAHRWKPSKHNFRTFEVQNNVGKTNCVSVPLQQLLVDDDSFANIYWGSEKPFKMFTG